MEKSLNRANGTSRAGTVCRARVVGRTPDGRLLAEYTDTRRHRVTCDVLETSSTAIPFASNESVLVLVEAARGSERGIVLGRITESDTGTPSVETPDELVIEARRSLTLRVGSGSITIREDGKILIKGKDLVSHATRLNRIKGGAVQIN